MSGGHFDYKQSQINEIADSIKHEIRYNEAGIECWSAKREYGVPHRPDDSEWVYTSWKDDKRYRVPKKNIIHGEPYYYESDENGIPIFDKPDGWGHHSPEVLEIFKESVKKLKEAAVYAQRIDWYLSGDDGEDNLIERLKEELEEVEREIKELDDNNWHIGVIEDDYED
jgi:hypothetical protein